MKHASIFLAMERSAHPGKTRGPATIAVPNSIDASALFWPVLLPGRLVRL